MRKVLSHKFTKKYYWHTILIDSLVVLSVFISIFFASSHFNISDQYFAWARAYEQSLDIDELLIALLAGLISLLWFAKRRMVEVSSLLTNNHALLQRVLEVQEAERKRIARDLHDELGQYLNAIKVQATSLLIDKNIPIESLKTAELIVTTADHAYQSARNMMHSLRPVALDELGLSAALEHLVETWKSLHISRACNQKSKPTPTQYFIHIEGNIDQFNEHINIALFRITQEALTNIAKHAMADEVVLHIHYLKHGLTLKIQDNGIGFDVHKKTDSYGLLGMIERAEAIGGELDIQCEAHLGTTITLTISASQLNLH